MVFSHPLLIKRKGHSLPGINESSDLRSTDSSSSIGQGGNSGFSSGDSTHVTPGISEFLKLMVPVEHFGRGLHVTPGISEFLKSMLPVEQGGNSGFSSGVSIHVTPGISEFLMLMVPVEHFGSTGGRGIHVTPGISEFLKSMVLVEHFGRGLHVKPGIKPVFLPSFKFSIGHGGKTTFRIKRMRHCKLQF